MARREPQTAPSSREIQSAVAHLVGLAAARDKKAPEKTDVDAERTLARVVALLSAHRARLIARKQRIARARFMEKVASVYRWFHRNKTVSPIDLRERLRTLLRKHGPVPCSFAEALQMLEVTREEIRTNRGPTQCAAERTAAIFDTEPRTMFNYKAERRPRVIWHIPKVRGTGKIRQTVMVSPFAVDVNESELVRYATGAIGAQKPKRLTGVRKLAKPAPSVA